MDDFDESTQRHFESEYGGTPDIGMSGAYDDKATELAKEKARTVSL
jgi:hypothetical protein